MRPRPVTDADMGYWGALDPERRLYGSDDEVKAGIEPVEAVVTRGDEFGAVVRVPWVLDEIDLAHLARGGTLWLCSWGGLPVHSLEVQAP